MPCSTRSRASSAPTSFRVASAPASGEDSLIARYFKPIATDPGAFALDDDHGVEAGPVVVFLEPGDIVDDGRGPGLDPAVIAVD